MRLTRRSLFAALTGVPLLKFSIPEAIPKRGIMDVLAAHLQPVQDVLGEAEYRRRLLAVGLAIVEVGHAPR